MDTPPEADEYVQPAPLDTWPGTDFNVIVDGTPVVPAPGKTAGVARDRKPTNASTAAAAPTSPPINTKMNSRV